MAEQASAANPGGTGATAAPLGGSPRDAAEHLALLAEVDALSPYSWDVAGGVVRGDAPFARLIGADETERVWPLERWRSLIHTDDSARVQAAADAQIDGHSEDVSLEYRLRGSSGEWIVVRDSSKAVERDERGSARRVVGACRDVTALRRMEAALRESEARLTQLTRTMPGGVFQLVLRPDGTMTLPYVSDGAQRLLGLAPAAIQSDPETILIRIPAEDRPRAREAILESAATLEDFSEDLRLRRPDGGEVVLRVAASPHRLPQGEVEWSGVALDITDQVRADEARRASEGALAELSQFSEEVVQGAGEGIVVFDPALVCLVWNRAMEAITGTAAERVVGAALERIESVLPGLLDRSLLERALGGETVRSEEAACTVPGLAEGAWVATTCTPFRDQPGAVAGVIVVVRDVTARKLAEAAVEESRRRFELLFDGIMDGVFVHGITADERPGQFLEVNQAACARLGYSRAELLSMSPKEIDAPESLADVAAVSRRLMAGEVVAFEQAHVARDGRRIPVEIVARAFGMQGRVTVLSVARDIGERRRAEQALRDSESRLRSIVRVAPIGIGLVCERRLIEVNTRVCEMLGRTAEELVGQSARVLYPTDEEFERVGRDKYRQIAELGTGTVETTWVRGDGTKIDVLLSSTPLDPSDLSAGVTFTALDITARWQAEEERERLREQLLQAQKMEAVGRLAGGVAHDFNNLLTIILGHGELALLKLGQQHPEAARLASVQEAALRARDLTQQILAFSRRQVLLVRTVDLNAEIASVQKMLSRLIGEDVRLETRFWHAPLAIRADSSQLQQVVLNLAVNARDAMPGGGLLTLETSEAWVDESEARAQAEVRPGRYAVLSVTDTGSGMDADTRRHLFEPFFTTKELGRGTGLGLATVYGIVKQHGGHISLRSEVGRGSSFHIYLPSVDSDAARPGERESELKIVGGSETILVVEDEASVRGLACAVLQELGYRVIEAASPEEALRLVRQDARAIDLLLTDVIMPGLSGRDLHTRLLTLRPGLRVLFMSGYSGDLIADHGVLDGGTEFLAKPFGRSALARKVREVLDGRRSP